MSSEVSTIIPSVSLCPGGSVSSEVSACIEEIKRLMTLTEDLVPKSDDVKTEEIGDMLDTEMQQTSRAIEQAASKIQVQ